MTGDQERIFCLKTNSIAKSPKWQGGNQKYTVEQLEAEFSRPIVRDAKEGKCYIPGIMLGDRRASEAVERIDLLVYDIDKDQSLAEALEKMSAAGVYAILHTSYSHGMTESKIQTNHYDAWATENDAPEVPELEHLLAFLEVKEKSHLQNVAYDPTRKKAVDAEGQHHVVTHDALEKYRVIIPLASSLVISTLAASTAKSIAAYKTIYHGVGRALGLKYDVACADSARVFYFPAHAPGRESYFQFHVVGDRAQLLDWTDAERYPRVTVEDVKTEKRGTSKKTKTAARVPTTVGKGEKSPRIVVPDCNGVEIDLTRWIVSDAGKAFDVEGALEHLAHTPRGSSGTGYHIQCPHEAGHSDTGGTGTFVTNDDGTGAWRIKCMHASCSQRDRLDQLARLIEQGELDAEALGISPPVAIDDLTPESTDEQIASALETLARSKPSRVALDSKLDEIGRKLGKTQARFKSDLAADYKAIAASLSASEKAPLAVSDDRLNLIDHALLFEMNEETPDQTRERARKHIEVQNRKGTPVIYKRGVHPVRLRRDTKSGLKVETLTATTFAAEVERWTLWGETQRKVTKATGCPSDIAEKLRTDPALDVPTLTDIRNAPFYTADGRLVASPGYHAASGVYYDPDGLDVGEIPDVPTDDEVRAAAVLVQKPYGEFPFNDGVKDPQGKASRANIIGRDVTAFVREMVDCVPMYLLDKTSHGAGGTLLANVGSIIATGKKAAVDTVKKDSYGWQQAFHSHALAGTSRILIDNVPKGYVIDDTNIAAYGTAARLEGRILGKSEVGGGDVRWILEWTGVNLGFSQENARRSIMVRIDPAMSSPGEREFDIPDLEAWTLENRSDLVRAHLILIQNWIAKGRPSWSGKALASFEAWSRVVGGILEAAGIKGFNGNRHLLEGKDSEAMRDFVQMWFDRFGSQPVRPGKVEFDFDAESDEVDNLAKLYVAAGEETYLGVSRKSRDIETLGARLGNKLTEVSGGAFRVETDKYKAHVVSHDYRITKCVRDKQGSAYQLERVAGTMRIWCRLPATCSRGQVAEEYAHLEAVRSDSL